MDHIACAVSETTTGVMYVFVMPLSALDRHWSSAEDASEWTEFSYNPHAGSILTLTAPAISGLIRSNPSPEGQNTAQEVSARVESRLAYLCTQVVSPVWSIDASQDASPLSEMLVFGFSREVEGFGQTLISYRIHFTSSHDSHLKSGDESLEPNDQGTTRIPLSITQAKSFCVPVSALPWNSGRCLFTSGHVICIDRPLRYYSLFSSDIQPLRSFDDQGIDICGEEMYDMRTAVDEWSGIMAAATKTSLSTYRLRNSES